MFTNREAAGSQLADALAPVVTDNSVVFALPRGGLPVAAMVAAGLHALLEVVLVRKIGAPFQPELAIGAVVDGAQPITIIHDDVVEVLGVTRAYIESAEKEALAEIDRRRRLYLRGRSPVRASGRTAIVVDDGVATGATVEAALKAIRKDKPKRLILAIPVAPKDALTRLRKHADEVVCLETPGPFWSVGSHYIDFPQLTDRDVQAVLEEHDKRIGSRPDSELAAV